MNFLQLAQRTARETRLTNWTNLLTVVRQGGQFRDVVDAVVEAWRDIQTRYDDWNWMRLSASFTTVAGSDEYTLGTGAGTVGVLTADFGRWLPDTFRNYVTAVGTNSEIPMDWLPWDAWRDTYRFGAMRNTRTRPVCIAVTPTHGIALGPNVDTGYTVTGDYYRSPVTLALDADIPAAPEKFHMAIVWRALELLNEGGATNEEQARAAKGRKEFGRMFRQMSADRQPQMVIGEPLA